MLHGYLGLDVSVATNIVSKVVGFILELSMPMTSFTAVFIEPFSFKKSKSHNSLVFL
jgi:hypothetical protein